MNIGQFYNVSELGHGGMGTVYSGYFNGKKVAIKKFRQDFMSEAEFIKRFRLEAQTLKKLNHPSIVKIMEPAHDTNNQFYPAFVENGELYLAMEFVEGQTLDKFVRANRGPLSEGKAIHIMCNILDAMEYVCQNGIIHRDIKPSNIIIRSDGSSICIIDFGIIKDLNSPGLTTERSVLGTDGYMSPEQAEGLTVDSRTDIYSLGCVLFYMLTGAHAIQKRASDYETRVAILKGDFPKVKDINPVLSDRIQSIINKAVNKDMRLRFQSPYEFKRELEASNLTVSGLVNKSNVDIISVGRDRNCDIPIYDPQEKVSRHHLDIEYQFTSEGSLYIISDRSTNGTRVNGRLLHKEKMNVFSEFRGRVNGDYPPEIILADTVELDWMQVLERFEKMQDTDGLNKVSYKDKSEQKSPVEDNLSIGYGLLSFFFPIVGWVLYFQWKQISPKKAKQAAMLAWVAFVTGMLMNTMI